MIKSVRLQTLYINPDKDQNMIDNSGVRIYFTEKLRQYDAGVIEMGDYDTSNPNGILPGTVE